MKTLRKHSREKDQFFLRLLLLAVILASIAFTL
jgi:hypothetical protein